VKPTKIYPVVVPANGSFPLQAMGDYFKILSATTDIEVRGDTFGTIGLIKAGQGLRNTDFNRLEFRDVSGFTNTIQVLVGDSDFVDERITGSVEVIDGGLNRTIANAAFASSKGLTPATSTNNVGIQIFNNGSTKNVIVEQVQVMSNATSGVFILRVDNVALGSPVAAVSKLAGGADSAIANLRSQEGVAWSGKTIAQIGWNAAFQNVAFTPKEPIVLPPGFGLSVTDGIVVAHSSWVNFEHYEQ